MASLREFFERLLPQSDGSSDAIAHVTTNGLTVVDTKKLMQREDVRKMFDSMRAKKNGTRQVFISKKK